MNSLRATQHSETSRLNPCVSVAILDALAVLAAAMLAVRWLLCHCSVHTLQVEPLLPLLDVRGTAAWQLHFQLLGVLGDPQASEELLFGLFCAVSTNLVLVK